jgi:hypothetical protein
MATKLEKELRREIEVEGEPYVLTISPTGLKLARKGKRKGVELTWRAIAGGDAALAAGLRASLDALPPR